MRTHVTELSVRYAETDRMGGAHHSSYLMWFELGRTGLLREAGHAYRDLEASGILLPVVEYRCRLLKGVDYDDLVRIETTVRELKSRVVVFAYRVTRGVELIAEGWTRHACVRPGNRVRRLPDELYQAMAPYAPLET